MEAPHLTAEAQMMHSSIQDAVYNCPKPTQPSLGPRGLQVQRRGWLPASVCIPALRATLLPSTTLGPNIRGRKKAELAPLSTLLSCPQVSGAWLPFFPRHSNCWVSCILGLCYLAGPYRHRRRALHKRPILLALS